MSVIEGTWTTPRVVIPSGPMLICEKGVITCVGGAENAPDVKAYDMFGNELEIKNVELGAKFKNMPNAYAEYINNGEEIIATMVKGYFTDSADYTLESVYNNAPK